MAIDLAGTGCVWLRSVVDIVPELSSVVLYGTPYTKDCSYTLIEVPTSKPANLGFAFLPTPRMGVSSASPSPVKR